MLNFSQINGYNGIVIAYIIGTMPASYYLGCLLGALTSTSNLYQGILNWIGLIILLLFFFLFCKMLFQSSQWCTYLSYARL